MLETRTAAHVVYQGGEAVRQEGASAWKEYDRERQAGMKTRYSCGLSRLQERGSPRIFEQPPCSLLNLPVQKRVAEASLHLLAFHTGYRWPLDGLILLCFPTVFRLKLDYFLCFGDSCEAENKQKKVTCFSGEVTAWVNYVWVLHGTISYNCGWT